MNNNFLLLNFCTEYASKGNTKNRMGKYACFGKIFDSVGNGIFQENTYTIKLYKIGDHLNKKKQNNACLTDRKGIVRHLKILKSVFKFNYCLKEEKDCFVLTLTLKDYLIYHKYMLTWVRYLYEYPFNVFLADAYRLKAMPEFKFESIINLFNLVGATSGIYEHGTGIHAIGETGWFKELMTTKEIQTSLKEVRILRIASLNDIFIVVNRNHNGFEDYCAPGTEGLKSIEDDYDALHSSDYWDSEEEFNKRLKLYKANYKILTNYKKK